MRTKRDWNKRYINQTTPWETGRADHNLVKAVSEFDIQPCRVLELGCGTGNNAIWLAGKGFEVIALDISDVALQRAKEKAVQQSAKITFLCRDILKDGLPSGPFDFVFDRGCFHSMRRLRSRRLFARRVYQELEDDGYWLSLMGNADAPPREVGPPRLTALDITRSIEQDFEILRLESTRFDSDQPDPHRAWLCMMNKRSR